MLTRRDFLAASLLLPAVASQTSTEHFIATIPLGAPGGARTTPLGRLLGNGLDARQFTDLSTIQADNASTLVTPNDRFYIRTASPGDTSGARGFSRATGV